MLESLALDSQQRFVLSGSPRNMSAMFNHGYSPSFFPSLISRIAVGANPNEQLVSPQSSTLWTSAPYKSRQLALTRKLYSASTGGRPLKKIQICHSTYIGYHRGCFMKVDLYIDAEQRIPAARYSPNFTVRLLDLAHHGKRQRPEQ